MMAGSERSVSWARRVWLLAVTIAVALAACSSDQRGGEPLGTVSLALTPAQQRILGFESVGGGSSDWTATSGTITQSMQHVEGNGSLAISKSGNTTITSGALSSLGPTAEKISLDILLPAIQPNPNWLGTLKLVIECPSQQLWWEGLAEHQLTGSPLGQFLRFEFPLSASVRGKLSTGTYSDLRFKILLNVASGAGPWLFDRLWVTGPDGGGSGGTGGSSHGGTGGSAGQGGSATPSSANAEILGFENSARWVMSAGSLASSDIRLEGAHALEVSGIGYAELTSDPLTTLGSVASVVGFDLSMPNPDGDVWWWGSAAISLDCPSKGIHGRWLGQQELDGSTLDRFRRVEVNLPDDVKISLSTGSYDDLRVKVILTVPQGSGPYVLDRFTFSQQQPEPAPPAPSEAASKAVGFETLEAWKASAATISLTSSALEGSSALAVSNFTQTELTSQRLSSLGSQIDSPVTVNVFFPEPPNPSWAGTIALSLDLPSAGIYSHWIGQHDMQGKTPNTWHRLAFPLPPATALALRGNYNDLRIKLILNRPEQLSALVFDELRFQNFTDVSPPAPLVEEYVIPLPKGMSFGNVFAGQALVKKSGRPGADFLWPPSGGPIAVSMPLAQPANVIAPRMGRSGGRADVTVGPWSGDVSAFLDVLGGPITGTARGGGVVQASATSSSSNVDLSSYEAGRIRVEFPANIATAPDVEVENESPQAPLELAPGTYGFVQLAPISDHQSHLRLRSGTYYLRGLALGTGGSPLVFVTIDNAQGPVFIHVKDSIEIRNGRWSRLAPEKHNVLLTYAGRSEEQMGGFEGTIIAPRVSVIRSKFPFSGSPPISGAIFARSLELTDPRGSSFHAFERDDCASLPDSGCGAFGCDTADTDADGLYDCEEQQGQWADPGIFNGVRVRASTACQPQAADACAGIDTLSEVDACLQANPALLEQNMYSGWALGARALQGVGCQDEMNFWPPWTECTDAESVSYNYSGFINLAESGTHCFTVPGTAPSVCGSLFLNDATEGITTTSGPQCFVLAAGVYPIRWFIEVPQAAVLDRVSVGYCYGGSAQCEATVAIPQAMLRPAGADCTTDANCLPAEYCSQSGQCHGEETACLNDGQCPNGKKCYAGLCADPPCAGLDECPSYCEQAPERGGCCVQQACTTNADCSDGEVCDANGEYFGGVSAERYCWPASCRTNQAVGCGGFCSPCGNCECKVNCGSKSCGDAPDNGCGGVCQGYCQGGETGCTEDWQCERGYVCQDDTCVIRECAVNPHGSCGFPGALCGESCPECTPRCDGAEWGYDPVCGEPCGSNNGACPADETPLPDGSCSAVVDPDAHPVDVPEPLPPSPTTTVGTAPTFVSVDDEGRPRVEIPLEVPPGRGGIEPRMSLRYSGGTVGGPLGVGWGLSGLSKITLCPRNTAHEQPAPLRLDHSDPYCLDGMRLVKVGNAGFRAPGSEYRTEVESFTRIVQEGGGPGRDADAFTAYRSNGEIWIYGRAPETRVLHTSDVLDAMVTREWLLWEVRDRVGNVMRFRYQSVQEPSRCNEPDRLFDLSSEPCGQRQMLLRSIGYGGNREIDAELDTFMVFNYEANATDPRTGWYRGAKIESTRLLKEIYTEVGGRRVHTYRLSYDEAGTFRQRSTLRQVEQCDGEGLVCKNPTELRYTLMTPFVEPTTTAYEAPSFGLGPAAVHWRSGGSVDWIGPTVNLDVDGDGTEDVVDSSNGELTVLFGAKRPEDALAVHQTGLRFPDDICFAQNTVLDYNGDGRDDILDACPRGGEYRVYVSDGSRFAETWLGKSGSTFERPTSEAFIADVNADNLPDLVQCVRGDDEDDLRYYPGLEQGGFGSNFDLPDFGKCKYDPEIPRGSIQLQQGFASSLAFAALSGNPSAKLQITMMNRPRFEPSFDFDQGLVAEVTPPSPMLIDVDGDGTANLLSYNVDEDEWAAFQFGSIPKWERIDFDSHDNYADPGPFMQNINMEDAVKALDVNGDGLLDLMAHRYSVRTTLQRQGFWIFSHWEETTKLVRSNAVLWINTGNGFKLANWNLTESDGRETLLADKPIDRGHFLAAQVFDVDRDGIDELIIPDDSLGECHWVVMKPDPVGEHLRSYEPFSSRVGCATAFHFADSDGDGDTDTLILNEDGNEVTADWGDRSAMYRLFDVVDGVGNRTLIDYDDPETYDSDAAAQAASVVARPASAVTGLVSKLERSERGGHGTLQANSKPTVVERFAYEGGRVGIHKRGWLGFASVRHQVLDDEGRLVIQTDTTLDNTTYDSELRDYPFAGIAASRITRSGWALEAAADPPESAARIVEVSSRLELLRSDQDIPFVAETGRSSTTYDEFLNGNRHELFSQSETSAFDEYGNTTSRESVLRNASGQEISSNASTSIFEPTDEEKADWLVFSPRSIERTSRRNGDSKRQEFGFTYYSNGLLWTTTRSPDGGSAFNKQTFGRDEVGNITSVTLEDAEQDLRETTIEYDDASRFPARVYDAELHLTRLDYDRRFGQVRTVVDPNGYVTQRSFDGFGRPSVIDAPTTRTTLGYSEARYEEVDGLPVFGAMRVTIDSIGHPGRVIELDGRGRVVRSVFEGYGGTPVSEELVRDFAGRVTQASRPHVGSTAAEGIIRTAFDGRGRVTSVQRPDSNDPDGVALTRFQYTSSARPQDESWFESASTVAAVRVRDPLGHSQVHVSDAAGLVERVVDANDGVLKFLRGAHGLVTRVTDPQGNRTTYEYDDYGRRTSQQDPDAGASQVFYTGFDEVDYLIDGAGDRTDFTYDDLGRLELREDIDGTSTYRYDGPGEAALGRLVQQESPDGVVTSYDFYPPGATGKVAGMLRSVTQSQDGQAHTTSYTYSAGGKLSSVTYPAQGRSVAVQYGYEANQLTRVEAIVNGITRPIWRFLEAEQGYRVSLERVGNGVVRSTTYDPLTGSVTRLTDTLGSDRIFDESTSYDSKGNVDGRTDHLNVWSEAYIYDDLDRLTEVRDQSDALLKEFSYDSIGNIAYQSDIGAYEYGAKPHAVTGVEGLALEYDDLGNNVRRTTDEGAVVSVDYNKWNLPKRYAKQPAGGGDEVAWRYAYDADGTRVSKKSEDGEESVEFIGGSTERITRAGITHERHGIFVNGRRVAELRLDQAEESLVFIHDDVRGSPRAVTDAAGEVQYQRRYSAFGTDGETGSDDESLQGFSGHGTDRESEFLDLGGRIYDPRLGRFLSPDPIIQAPTDAQSWNPYTYAFNNPLSFVDPSGLCSVPLVGMPGGCGAGYMVDDMGASSDVPTYPLTVEGTAPTSSETPPAVELEQADSAPSHSAFDPIETIGLSMQLHELNRLGGMGRPEGNSATDVRVDGGNGDTHRVVTPSNRSSATAGREGFVRRTELEVQEGGFAPQAAPSAGASPQAPFVKDGRITDAGRKILRRTFDRYNFDVGQIKVIFKKNLGQAGITLGNRVYLDDSFQYRRPYDQMSLLAHEITHSVQYRDLGKANFLERYAVGYKQPGNYDVPIELWAVPTNKLSVTQTGSYLGPDGMRYDFTLDQIAERIGIETASGLPYP